MHTHRISPPLRGSSPSPRKMPSILESKTPLSVPPPSTALPTQPGPELELATSPVTQASPSPGPSSAVQPPPPSAVVSDPQSQRHSVIGENGVGSTSRDQSVDPSSESSQLLFFWNIR
jgi:hypothetical protein